MSKKSNFNYLFFRAECSLRADGTGPTHRNVLPGVQEPAGACRSRSPAPHGRQVPYRHQQPGAIKD